MQEIKGNPILFNNAKGNFKYEQIEGKSELETKQCRHNIKKTVNAGINSRAIQNHSSYINSTTSTSV